MSYSPATKPTFYFIGVTTGSSSIMRVFPEWAKYLGLGDVQIKGIDLEIQITKNICRTDFLHLHARFPVLEYF